MNNQFLGKNAPQHRIFTADSKLSPNEINDLLGIRIQVEPEALVDTKRQAFIKSCNRLLRLAVVTLVLTGIALVGSMYQLKIGPFYDEEVFASTEL